MIVIIYTFCLSYLQPRNVMNIYSSMYKPNTLAYIEYCHIE